MIATRSCLTLFRFTAASLLRDSLESMATHTGMEALGSEPREWGFASSGCKLNPSPPDNAMEIYFDFDWSLLLPIAGYTLLAAVMWVWCNPLR